MRAQRDSPAPRKPSRKRVNVSQARGAKAMVAMCYGGSMPFGIYTQEIATRAEAAMWTNLSRMQKCCDGRRATSMNVR